ncbi:unnamed protein product [Heterobilharzia americana]|nr:unnamed protein product [Heterobilharzia americana]
MNKVIIKIKTNYLAISLIFTRLYNHFRIQQKLTEGDMGDHVKEEEDEKQTEDHLVSLKVQRGEVMKYKSSERCNPKTDVFQP